MLHFVGCILVTDVSKVRNSFMLIVKQFKSTVLVLLDSEDDSIMILLIVGKFCQHTGHIISEVLKFSIGITLLTAKLNHSSMVSSIRTANYS